MLTLLKIMLNETHKGLIILWDYKFNLLMQLFGIFFIVIGIMFFVGQGQITGEQVTTTILGFIITMYATESVSSMSWELMGEAQAGTLEQMYMSPAPTQIVILGRSIASMISATLQMLLLTSVILLLFRVQIPLNWQMLPILGITMIGLFGIGYLVGGMTLVFKQVGPLANLLQNFVIMANGTFLPVAMMPVWLGTIVQFVPSTLGIILLRRVALEGASLSSLVSDNSLLILTLHSIAFFIIGWLGFAFCERYAKRQGSLGQY